MNGIMAEGKSRPLKEIMSLLFEIRATRKGIVPISYPAHIRIVKQLEKHPMSFNALADNLKNDSKSTLFTQLEDLVNAGVIGKRLKNSQNIYFIDSRVFLSSATKTEVDQKITASIAKTLTDDASTYMMKILILTMASWKRMGIDISCEVKHFGHFIAKTFQEKLKSRTMEEMLSRLNTYSNKLKISQITVYSFNPLTIIIESDTMVQEQSLDMDFITGLIIGTLNANFDKNYHITNIEKIDDRRKKIRLESASALSDIDSDNLLEKIVETGYFYNFLVVNVSSSVYLVPHKIQMEIILCLKNGPRCIQELMDALNLSRPSITEHVIKLLNNGLITEARTNTGGLYYRINCRIVINRNEECNTDIPWDVLDLLIGQQIVGIYEGMYYYINFTTKKMKIEDNEFWTFNGEEHAAHLISAYPNNESDITQAFEKCMKIEGVEVEIISPLPYTLRISSPMMICDTKYAVIEYYAGAIRHLLEKKTGQNVHVIESDLTYSKLRYAGTFQYRLDCVHLVEQNNTADENPL
jgi:DNA-binding HxlR family transcriptional regulator/predicted hydrocarbon binding protein